MTAVAQAELDFSEQRQSRGHTDVLAHLGAATVESVENIIRVVASERESFTWEDIEAQLPDGIRQKLASSLLRMCAPGALVKNYAKRYGLRAVGYTKATNPDARGRPIRVWSAR